MVFLTAYFDESEAESLGGITTLAGWIGTHEAWAAFMPKWQEMLDSAPHPITEFHSASLFHASGEFSDENGWTDQERLDLVKRATDIMVDPDPAMRLIAAIGCTITADLAFPVDGRLRTITAYDLWKFCAFSCVHDSIDFITKSGGAMGTTLDFVFDEKEKLQGYLLEYFVKLKASFPQDRQMLGAASFVDSKSVLPLQAADYIAYERRLQTQRRLKKDGRKERKSYVRLRESGRIGHFKVLDHRFHAIMADCDQAELAGLPRPPIMERMPREPD